MKLKPRTWECTKGHTTLCGEENCTTCGQSQADANHEWTKNFLKRLKEFQERSKNYKVRVGVRA